MERARMTKRNLGAMKDRGGYQQEIKALLDVLTFGKYKGLTVERVIEIDADYILWASDSKTMQVSEEVLRYSEEASDAQQWDANDAGLFSIWDVIGGRD
jgi:hypothetical protein